MTLDDMAIWLMVFAAAMFIVSGAILVYACSLLLYVQMKVRQFTWRPEVVRNGERRRQERL